MNNISTELNINKCTGCSACVNVCSFDAMSMKPDKDGFIIPVVNDDLCVECRECVEKCPVLNFSQNNNSKPKLFAVRANDQIRAVSSSGGFFTVAADYILSNKGYVCGAAFDEDISLNHIIVKDEEELSKLRGSKYVQSNIGTVYREIKRYLDDKKDVLFSGTPCQVAGLKNYLGKDYENLITIDLLCHGVPSETVLKRYLSEKFKGKTVTGINFRDKRFGWSAEHIIVKFSDGSEYHGTSKTDSYLKAFLKNLDLRKSCEECKFSEFPRQGDISLGDFWGITAIDKTQNDKKGTSLLFANNQKGENFLNKVLKKVTIKEFPFESTAVKNRTNIFFRHEPNRYRFFKFMENERVSFEMAVEKSITFKYDIGIVSNFYAKNFGGSLTQYALYNTLEDMGYSCLMIERPADSLDVADLEGMKKIYEEIPYKSRTMAFQRKTKEEMRSLNTRCDTFIVGSDQLFQYNLYKALGRFVSLDWVEGSKKKIAYAASFGHDRIWGDKVGLSEMSFFINRFDAFSVREESAVSIMRDNFGMDAQWVLDPVFLCNTKHYDELIEKSGEKHPSHFIASYILDPSSEKAEILKATEKKTKNSAIVFSEFLRIGEYTAPLKEFDVRDPKVEGRLKLIKNCDFFVTDSFHGTCFAIIMNKPFVSVMNEKRGASRFVSLLKKFGLEDRLVSGYDEELLNKIIETPINFDKVNSILNKERERCIAWLKNAILSDKKLEISAYDVLMNRIIKQESEIQTLKDMVSSLISVQDSGLKFITEPVMYFNELASKKDKYIIVMSVKDTAGMSVRSDVVEAMKKAGFTLSIKDKHWQSYVAISDGGNIVYEKLSSDEIVYRGKVSGIDMVVVSRHYKNGNVSKNIIGGKEYSVNRRGLNITVIDKNTNNIIDSVGFDMHLNKYSYFRK